MSQARNPSFADYHSQAGRRGAQGGAHQGRRGSRGIVERGIPVHPLYL